MSGEQNDELIRRLAAEDPAANLEEGEGLARVRAQIAAGRPPQESWLRRRRGGIVLGLATAAAMALALVILLAADTPVGGGTEPALAIERTPREIVLRIEDPTASDEQMNAELETAGIEGVRVLSLPGPDKDVGTWAGAAEFGLNCEGHTTSYGGDVNIPAVKEYTTGPADNRDLIDLDDLIELSYPNGEEALGQSEIAVGISELATPYSGTVARIDAKTIDGPGNSTKVLVPIKPEDGVTSNEIGVEQLRALGGQFAVIADRLESQSTCEDLGYRPVPTEPELPSDEDLPPDLRGEPIALSCIRQIVQRGYGLAWEKGVDLPPAAARELIACNEAVSAR